MRHLFHIHEDAELLTKQLTKEATGDESLQAHQLLKQHPRLNEEIKTLRKGRELEQAFQTYSRYDSQKAYRRFLRQIQPVAAQKLHHRRNHYRWYAATAAVMLLLIGFYMINRNEAKEKKELVILTPGEAKGMLELANGEQIGVEKQELSIVEGDIQVNYKQGTLSYIPAKQQPIHQEPDKNEKNNDYNKFVIPKGGENTVVLSDGTTVHLNSDSKLTYPVHFKGKHRIVMLEGEAFFDVAEDPVHPFIVRTHYGEVCVLGTAFNIDAYPGNEACYTTLARGKVRVSTPLDEFQELTPGEQAIVRVDRIKKRNVDIEDYVGWINGIFSFHGETLYNIMSKLERWYNMEVIYEDPALKRLTYTGTIKRYENINSFLDAFELTGDLTYRIQGRCVHLSNKTE